MKRVLAIAVVFALVAGAAFAEISIGGGFGYSATIVESEYSADSNGGQASEITSGAHEQGAQITANFSGEKFGGRVRIYALMTKGWWQSVDGDGNMKGAPFAHAWWKPVNMFKFQLGHNPDGDWGTGITGWGFHAAAQNYVAIDDNVSWYGTNAFWRTARGTGFYGGFSDVGATLSVYPLSMLDINVGIPFSGTGHSDGDPAAYEVYRRLNVNVKYRLEGFGTANLSFIGKSQKIAGESAGDLYASFLLTAVEGLQVDLGVKFGLPYLAYNYNQVDYEDGTVVMPSFGIGLGVTFAKGITGFKFRFGANLSSGRVDDGKDDATTLGFVLMPYVNLEKIQIYFNLGLGTYLPVPDSNLTISKPAVDWYVNPYVKVPAGGLNFWAGFKLYGVYASQNSSSVLHWGVPIGVSVDF